ncbi:MAG: hypothetical protein IPO19_12155 [Rhodoferax sp.]|nr:hypothetical protein [Rhodoferax sp.]
MNNPKQLKARFPYQFAGKNIGLSISRGWFLLFEKLCEDIDHLLGDDKHDFHWTQLKEKFGAARFYFALDGKSEMFIDFISPHGVKTVRPTTAKHETEANLRQQIQALINKATSSTNRLCIVCGEPGAVDQFENYLLVLCKPHADLRRLDQLPPAWFEEDEQ